MPNNALAVIDANLNRLSEGLRVIEEYARFVAKKKALTDQLANLRHQVGSLTKTYYPQMLAIRNIREDMRALDPPSKRETYLALLVANFKRAEEACRVLEEYTGHTGFNEIRYALYDLEKEVVLNLGKADIKPGVYLISDQISVLKQGLEWGVSLIQYRSKSGSKTDIYEASKILAPLAKTKDIPFIVNDHLDIALAVDADGLHTGQDDIPIPIQRRLLGPHKLIGRTTHTLDQGLVAQTEGADYVSVGPIWETPSKPGRASIGFEYLRDAHSHLKIPYVAIGGVNRNNVNDVFKFNPPLIGLIRDYEGIPDIQNGWPLGTK